MAWNQHLLSSGSLDKTIVNSDVRQKEAAVSTIKLHRKEVCGLKWHPGGNYLASGGNDNMLHIWDAQKIDQQSPTPLFTFDQHTAAVKVSFLLCEARAPF